VIITVRSRFGKAVGYFDNDPDVNVAKEIGKFYQTKTVGYSRIITSLQKKLRGRYRN
jgi:hypothetical protein